MGVQEDGYVPVICAFGRTTDADVERAWESVSARRRLPGRPMLRSKEACMHFGGRGSLLIFE